MNTSNQKNSGTTGAKMSDKKTDTKSTASKGSNKSTDDKKSTSTKKN
ncbi:hypothetical protein NJT12_09955 [Flavobacterium sp. AC]|uniref:Uncharacterized protein n=1 Tax=Flavobacterium azizsancarii TaxID=2961580 RepID=A0ABT4WCT9_9FLAO|nr:hypothetical protein [Flavobacterium azizsancarii]MDA6069939.1 hypothetical protein [Flavobacterium azizsancarii]